MCPLSLQLLGGKYRGPAQAGSPRSHWENKLDSEQNGCFLSGISFSCTKEGIPDLPGGTKAVILKGKVPGPAASALPENLFGTNFWPHSDLLD